jgi:hypothetical protein
MVKVFLYAAGELIRSHLHTFQHPFNDVAVVAEKTSWCARIVAMIGSYLPSAEGSTANGATSVLMNEKFINQVGREASPTLALFGDTVCPFSGARFYRLILGQLYGLAAFALTVCAAAGLGFGRVISLSFAVLCVIGRVIRSVLFFDRISISGGPLSHVGEIHGPFLRRAFIFTLPSCHRDAIHRYSSAA